MCMVALPRPRTDDLANNWLVSGIEALEQGLQPLRRCSWVSMSIGDGFQIWQAIIIRF